LESLGVFLLVDCLEGLAQSLIANQCAFEEQKIVHPKMAALVDIATKLKKKKDKESVKVLALLLPGRWLTLLAKFKFTENKTDRQAGRQADRQIKKQ
jgi:hypothetical protein